MNIDNTLYWASQAGLLADYAQTRHISEMGRESNPLLGKHPSELKMGLYFGGAMLANHYIPPMLPKDVERFVRGGILLYQIGSVLNNKRIGVEFKF